MAVFRRFSDRESLYVPTPAPKPVGTETRFLITLAGGEPMLAGAGNVIEANESRDNSFGRPGMKLAFTKLDDKSKRIVERLSAARAAAKVAPPGMGAIPLPKHIRPKPRPGTVPPASAELAAESEAVRYAAVMREAQRAPGSQDVLPANPFGELTDASLEAFIECTLYEETGSIRIDNTPGPGANGASDLPVWWPKADKDPAAPPAAEQAPADEAPVASPRAASKAAPLTPDEAVDSLGVELPDVADAPPLRPEAPTAEVRASGELLSNATPTMVPLDPFASPRSATPLGFATDTDLVERIPRKPLWKIVVFTAVATSVLSFAIGYWWFGQRKKDRARAIAAAKANEPVKVPGETTPAPANSALTPGDAVEFDAAVSDEQAALDAPDAGDRAPVADDDGANEAATKPGPTDSDDDPLAASPEAARLAPGGGNCLAKITSKPTGAIVTMGGTRVGTTPFEASLPCGEVTLEFERSRYADVSRAFEITDGAALELDLERPMFRVTVTSSPPGATVKIGAQRVGTTPVTKSIRGFEQASISVTKDGYKSYSTKYYPKGNGSVKATLAPVKPATKPTKKSGKRRTN